jgi:hypothetical protein
VVERLVPIPVGTDEFTLNAQITERVKTGEFPEQVLSAWRHRCAVRTARSLEDWLAAARDGGEGRDPTDAINARGAASKDMCVATLHVLTRRSGDQPLRRDAELTVDLEQFVDGLDAHEVSQTWHHDVARTLERACRRDEELRRVCVQAARQPRIG